MVAKSPMVSILMPVRNEEKNLVRSVESAISQTMEDWELIISDNGSSDRSWEIMMEKRRIEKRIRVIRNRNIGFTHSLNLLIGLAGGKYIARLDADDEFMPDKLEKQLAILEGAPEVLMVAGKCMVVDESGKSLYEHGPPPTTKEIRWSLIFRNDFWHSSTMWRSESNMKYNENFSCAQDYELWSRMARQNDIASPQEIVAKITKRSGSITDKRSEEQKSFANVVSKRNMEYYLGREIDEQSSEGIRQLHIHGNGDEKAKLLYEEMKTNFGKKET